MSMESFILTPLFNHLVGFHCCSARWLRSPSVTRMHLGKQMLVFNKPGTVLNLLHTQLWGERLERQCEPWWVALLNNEGRRTDFAYRSSAVRKPHRTWSRFYSRLIRSRTRFQRFCFCSSYKESHSFSGVGTSSRSASLQIIYKK